MRGCRCMGNCVGVCGCVCLGGGVRACVCFIQIFFRTMTFLLYVMLGRVSL